MPYELIDFSLQDGLARVHLKAANPTSGRSALHGESLAVSALVAELAPVFEARS